MSVRASAALPRTWHAPGKESLRVPDASSPDHRVADVAPGVPGRPPFSPLDSEPPGRRSSRDRGFEHRTALSARARHLSASLLAAIVHPPPTSRPKTLKKGGVSHRNCGLRHCRRQQPCLNRIQCENWRFETLTPACRDRRCLALHGHVVGAAAHSRRFVLKRLIDVVKANLLRAQLVGVDPASERRTSLIPTRGPATLRSPSRSVAR
jgi:hypothetical protein